MFYQKFNNHSTKYLIERAFNVSSDQTIDIYKKLNIRAELISEDKIIKITNGSEFIKLNILIYTDQLLHGNNGLIYKVNEEASKIYLESLKV